MPTDADMQAMQQVVSASLQTVIKDLGKLQEKAKDVSGPNSGLGQVSSVIGGLTSKLAGPVGLAAGLYAVMEALNNFSRSRLVLENFATDVGATTKYVDAMTLALDRAGISANEAQPSIMKLGALVKDLGARGEGSKLDQLFRETGVSAAERAKLIEEARTDRPKAMEHSIEIMTRGNKELRAYYSEQTSLAESHLLAMKKTQAEIGKVYEANLEAAKRTTGIMSDLKQGVKNLWDQAWDNFNKNVSKMDEATGGKLAEWGDQFARSGAGEQKGRDALPTIEPRELPWWLNFGKVGADAYGSGDSFKERYGKWPSEGTRSGITDFGGRRRTDRSDDLIRTEEDSNKHLRDIRDTLKRMEDDQAKDDDGKGGGSGGGGGASGGGGGLFGIRRRGNRPAEGSSGGDVPSFKEKYSIDGPKDDSGASVGTGAFDRSKFAEELKNNPGLANRIQTIVQGEVGHNAPAWKKMLAAETIFNRAAARGQSLAQVTKQYTGQGSDGYYPGSTFSGGAIKSAEEQSEFQEKILKKVLGGSDVSTQRLGFPATGNASAGVAARGAASGRYTRYGQAEPGKRPGDPGIETWVQEGNWGRGGRGAREDISRLEASRRRFGMGATPFYDPAGERAAIDQSQSLGGRIDAAMSATVDFKNMPSWVKTNVEQNGKFKDLRVTHGSPQAGKAGEAAYGSRWTPE